MGEGVRGGGLGERQRTEEDWRGTGVSSSRGRVLQRRVRGAGLLGGWALPV